MNSLIKALKITGFLIAGLGLIETLYGGFFDALLDMHQFLYDYRRFTHFMGHLIPSSWKHPVWLLHLISHGDAVNTLDYYEVGLLTMLAGFIVLGFLSLREQKVYEETVLKPEWFYELDSRSIGPISKIHMNQWITEKLIEPDQLVRRKDEVHWRRLGDIPDFQPEPPAEAATPG